jgi:hypothetical protein
MDYFTLGNANIYMISAPKDLDMAEMVGIEIEENRIESVMVLLGKEELTRLYGDTNSLFKVYSSYGAKVISYPIPDFEVPKDMNTFNNAVKVILGYVKNGKNVMVHCWGGHGRTGIMTVGICVKAGISVDNAYNMISKKRKILETMEQFEFLYDYEEYCVKSGSKNATKRGTARGSQ